ncbi:MAG: hypothetical protein M5U14_03370 [Acidimicrobiia bacterium]|nr:hypothetical protein [Acidimicrobiia bacterium]
MSGTLSGLEEGRPALVALDPPRLLGSRDPETGQVFFPRRALAVDGSLRPCEPVDLPTEGTLHTWTVMGEDAYGQVDLPGGPRIQTRLAPGAHEIDARYRLEARRADDGSIDWWFRRA